MMTAKETIVSNKTTIQDILCDNDGLILEKVMEKKLITRAQHRDLNSINMGTVMNKICRLVDMIIGKGETICKAFLDLLQTDDKIKETFGSRLEEEIKWGNYAGGPVQNKVQEAVCDDQYKLTSKPTGLCVIMNNENFHNNSKPARVGATQDAVDLARTFSWLGFRVLMYKNHTKFQMEVTLKLLSSLENPGELVRHREEMIWEWIGDEFTNTKINDDDLPQHGDAFVCCIMSHGDKGGVFGTDMERLSIDDITATFSGDKCPLLNQKPKVFFIEACQKGQPGGQAGSLGVKQAIPSRMVVEAEADFLVAMATVDDHEATRHAINGTWFVQCLWKGLRELCPSGKDLTTILKKVNGDVSKKGAQMPKFNTSFRKNLVFKPSSK